MNTCLTSSFFMKMNINAIIKKLLHFHQIANSSKNKKAKKLNPTRIRMRCSWNAHELVADVCLCTTSAEMGLKVSTQAEHAHLQ